MKKREHQILLEEKINLKTRKTLSRRNSLETINFIKCNIKQSKFVKNYQ